MNQPQTDFTDDQLLSHARRLSDEFSGRAAEFDLARKLGQGARCHGASRLLSTLRASVFGRTGGIPSCQCKDFRAFGAR